MPQENSNKLTTGPSEDKDTSKKINSIEIPQINLPKGGGAIKSIDEKFSVNAVNGTSGFSIPLPFFPLQEDFRRDFFGFKRN